MEHIMLDLETMGTGPTAAIIAIGAVLFEPNVEHLGPHFYVTVDLASSVAQGGAMDPATVLWWMGQSDEARSALKVNGEPIHVALEMFSKWLRAHVSPTEAKIWGNGAAFDNVVLASAYERSGIARPWAFWNDRCYRTVKALHPHLKMQRQGTHHNALDDAESQALHLISILGRKVTSGA